MKSVMRGAMLAVAGVFAFAAAAHADTLEVKVPFEFMVGAQKMPAGSYRIEHDLSMPSSVVLIQGRDGTRAQLFVQTTPLLGASPAGAETPALVFVPDETGHRLTQVWGASTVGQEIARDRGGSHRVSEIVTAAQPRS